jgi:hypothetical protein
MLRFLAIQESFKRTHFVPPGDRRVRGFDFRKFRALLFVACSKEFVIRMGTQAGTASPIHFAHAGRHHQIPADQGERSGVAESHGCPSSRDDQQTERNGGRPLRRCTRQSRRFLTGPALHRASRRG